MRNMVTGVKERSSEVREAMMEQSEGSKQVLDSLGKMSQISQTVRSGSDEINNGSSLVLNETMRLRDASDENGERISEIVASVSQINQAVHNVMEISDTNKEMVSRRKDKRDRGAHSGQPAADSVSATCAKAIHSPTACGGAMSVRSDIRRCTPDAVS